MSKSGRAYVSGKSLFSDFRVTAVNNIIRNGGDPKTGNFPGKFVDIARPLKLSSACVSKLHEGQVLFGRNIKSEKTRWRKPSHLSPGDLQLIEALKRHVDQLQGNSRRTA